MNYVHQSVRGAEFTDYYYMPSLACPHHSAAPISTIDIAAVCFIESP